MEPLAPIFTVDSPVLGSTFKRTGPSGVSALISPGLRGVFSSMATGAGDSCIKRIPAMSFIGGLAGADLTVGHFERVIRRTAELARDGRAAETVWVNEKD